MIGCGSKSCSPRVVGTRVKDLGVEVKFIGHLSMNIS